MSSLHNNIHFGEVVAGLGIACLKFIAVVSASWLTTAMLCAQSLDDKVVIADATDHYVFTFTGGKVAVKSQQETTYELLANENQRIRPYVIYGNGITMDKASCGRLKQIHRSYTPEDVFFDDKKVCFFDDVLTRKHPTQTARFQRTFSDGRMLARISLQNEYFIRHKTVTVTVPQALSKVSIVGINLPEQVTVRAEKTGTDSVFTYTVTNLPAWREEPCSPPDNLVGPCLLITGLFKDYTDLYRWGNRLNQVDTGVEKMDSLIARIAAGCATGQERIANTFQWVQQNIRYVAYEAGIAGFRPDRPAEVLRKRYGDCKGMALLLKTLLKAQGFDARLVTVGTSQLPYDISVYPSLASADHIVCAVMQDGQPLFLDATFQYIPAGYVPQPIQGRQAIMEDGDDCQLITLPPMPSAASVDSVNYDYQVDVSLRQLHGRVTCSMSGEMKEYFMNMYEHCKQSDKADLLASALDANDRSNMITGAAWADNDSRHEKAIITGMADNGHAVTASGDKVYVDLHPHNTYIVRIDTACRHNDYYMPMLYNTVREVRLQVPQGYEVVHLPENFLQATAYGRFSCTFQRRDSCIVFCQRATLTKRHIPRQAIPEWNNAVGRWTDACNEQVILKRTE